MNSLTKKVIDKALILKPLSTSDITSSLRLIGRLCSMWYSRVSM